MLLKVTGGYLEVDTLGQPGVPTHPIHYPPYVDNSLPGSQPYPDHGLPRPPGRPTHPIYYPGARPEHPIVIPPPPEVPPPTGVKPPPEGGGWGYSSEYGWGYFPSPTQAGPK